ncbi:hypothetical protein HYH02_014874 [Chlamydomonas schloesseri]|uniref:Uncharacterized protein n=1 Tax=Chlamydomonas schloesseri TaxID=2026947 RepID=A0A835VUN1_9CHLO|nr:hypothetical protein HYH02_014874 [Chlamydomonas schloesseri]|eukprot:KAG2426119.1 hypothetical protein HYH02_014874 [Chlamydomonas schloesseri]
MRVGLLGPASVSADDPVVVSAAALMAQKQSEGGVLQKLFARASAINLAAHGDDEVELEDEDNEELRYPSSESESESECESEYALSTGGESEEEEEEGSVEWPMSDDEDPTLAQALELAELGFD